MYIPSTYTPVSVAVLLMPHSQRKHDVLVNVLTCCLGSELVGLGEIFEPQVALSVKQPRKSILLLTITRLDRRPSPKVRWH